MRPYAAGIVPSDTPAGHLTKVCAHVWEYRPAAAGGGALLRSGWDSPGRTCALALQFARLQQTLLLFKARPVEATDRPATRRLKNHEPCVCGARTSPSPPTTELFCLSCAAARPAPKARPKSSLDLGDFIPADEHAPEAWEPTDRVRYIKSGACTSAALNCF